MKTAKNRYWYSDNWHGEVKKFADLVAAKVHAVKNNMGQVTIYGPDGIAASVQGERYFA